MSVKIEIFFNVRFILSIKINNGCGRRKARSGYLPRLGRSRKVCRGPAGVENRLLLRICANDDVTTNSCFKLVSKSSDFPWPNFLYGPTVRYIIPKKKWREITSPRSCSDTCDRCMISDSHQLYICLNKSF